MRCRARPPAFDGLQAAYVYQDPIDAVIHALKFKGLEFLGGQLADVIDRRVGATLPRCDLVVPVPIAWARRLRRGFNQAELIARPLAKRLGVPAIGDALRRAGGKPAQSRSSRSRRFSNVDNVFNVFGVRRERLLVGQTVLLVDDVATTTATLHQAALALRKAGAARVFAVVVARTLDRPRPEH